MLNIAGFKSFIPESPIPSFQDIAKALVYQRPDGDNSWFPWCNHGKEIYFFSRGAWAIAALVQRLLAGTDKGYVNIFLPDYFCNSTLQPIRRPDVRLIFYPISENLLPDWQAIEKLRQSSTTPDLFILVHYFGFSCGAEVAYDYCQRVGSVLLEDCAHVLLPTPEIGNRGDAVIYSPYKVLGVPDGGLLVINRSSFPNLPRNNESGTRGDSGSFFQAEDGPSSAYQALWLLKKAVQRMCMTLKISWKREAGADHGSDGGGIVGENRAMSLLANNLLRIYQQDMKLLEEQRRENFSILNAMVRKLGPVARPFLSELPSGSVPFFYPMLIQKEHINTVYLRLNNSGIPARSWPDLPPEVKNDPSKHRVAVLLRQSLLSIPAHHSLNHNDIKYIVRKLRASIDNLSNRKGV